MKAGEGSECQAYGNQLSQFLAEFLSSDAFWETKREVTSLLLLKKFS